MQHRTQCNTLKCLFAYVAFLFSFSSLLPDIGFLLQLLYLIVTLELMKASPLTGWRQSVFSEGFLPLEHAAARDKLVLKSKGAFKTRPLSAGALLMTELFMGPCCGIHRAVDYFLLRKRRKQASSSVMKDLLFVLHAVLPRYCNDWCL